MDEISGNIDGKELTRQEAEVVWNQYVLGGFVQDTRHNEEYLKSTASKEVEEEGRLYAEERAKEQSKADSADLLKSIGL